MNAFDKGAVQQANVAMRQVLAFHNREVTPEQPPKGSIFHYTTADGLKGIIENNELWATSACFLNDSAEITYGYSLLREALNEWAIKNPPSQFALGVIRELSTVFGEVHGRLMTPIYLTCFCEDDNLLSQWRAYGQSGGYSLGVKVPSDGISWAGLKPEPSIYTARWVRVEYDRTEQMRKCTVILDSLLPMFNNPDISQALTTLESHFLLGYSAIRRFIADILLEEIVAFKNKAFEVEKEWRIVVRRRELTKQGTDDGGKTPLPVYFRSSRGGLIPYVKLIPVEPKDKLPVVCARTGPTLDKTLAGMAVRMMLDKNGFSNVTVDGSDITSRF